MGLTIATQATYAANIGSAGAPMAINITSTDAIGIELLSTPPSVHFSQSAVGLTVVGAGQSVTINPNLRVISDPGQMDTPGVLTFSYSQPGAPAPTVVTVPLWYRALNYQTSGSPPGTTIARILADRWVCIHPGGKWGLLEVQTSPILVRYQAAAPAGGDRTGQIVSPGEVINVDATTPKIWARGCVLWPGLPSQYSDGGLYQVYAASVVASVAP